MSLLETSLEKGASEEEVLAQGEVGVMEEENSCWCADDAKRRLRPRREMPWRSMPRGKRLGAWAYTECYWGCYSAGHVLVLLELLVGGQGPQGRAVQALVCPPGGTDRLGAVVPVLTANCQLALAPLWPSAICVALHVALAAVPAAQGFIVVLGSIHTSAVRVRGCCFRTTAMSQTSRLLLHLGRELGGAASRQRTELHGQLI